MYHGEARWLSMLQNLSQFLDVQYLDISYRLSPVLLSAGQMTSALLPAIS